TDNRDATTGHKSMKRRQKVARADRRTRRGSLRYLKSMYDSKIAIIGSGFVGQATGKGLEKHNNDITFIDVMRDKVDQLRAEGFKAFLPKDYTKITTDVTMFCVPTPTEGNAIRLDFLLEATRQFAHRLKD